MAPGLLLAPGWSQNATVAAALQAKTEGINGVFSCNCLLDIAADSTGAVVYTDVKTAKEGMGASSNHAVALWPEVAVGEKQYYFSAMFGALTAYTDASNGDVPYKSPSNKNLKVTATVLHDGSTVDLDQEQGNLLNGQGVITAINANGFKSWGNNTAAYPSTTDPKDRWFAVRRMFDWDGNNFILTYFQKVDEPGDRRLIQSIVDSQNIIGNSYVARGYCAGYLVEFRDDENPDTELLNGHFVFHTSLAPYTPAEFIENIREYDVDALTSAILGGE
jgi:phage tail sheath protein FI